MKLKFLFVLIVLIAITPGLRAQSPVIAYYPFKIFRSNENMGNNEPMSARLPSIILDNLSFLGAEFTQLRVPETALDIDTMRNAGKYNTTEETGEIKVRSEFLNSEDISYVLTGSVKIEKNNFDFHLRLSDPVRYKKVLYQLDTYFVERKDLPDIIKIVTYNIQLAINSVSKSDYKVAMVRFAPVTVDKKHKSDNNDFPEFSSIHFEEILYDQLLLNGSFRLVPFTETGFYITNKETIKQLFDSAGYDAIVGGYYDDKIKTFVKVTPVVYSRLLFPDTLVINADYIRPTYLGDVGDLFGKPLVHSINALSTGNTEFAFVDTGIKYEYEIKKADSLFMVNNMPLAILSAERAFDKAANDKERIKALNVLGNIYMSRKDLAQAREYYSSSVALDSNPQNINGIYGLSQVEIQEKNYEKALSFLIPLANYYENDANIFASLGMTYYYLDSVSIAVAALKKAYELNPRLPIPNLLLINIASEHNNFDVIAACLSNLFNSQLVSEQNLLTVMQDLETKTKNYIDSNNLPVAESYAELTYKFFPGTRTLYSYVTTLLLQNKIQQADEYIQAGLNNGLFENKHIYKSVGGVLRTPVNSDGTYNNNHYLNSVSYYKKHAFLYPDDIDVYRLIGTGYFRLQLYDSALVYYKKVLKLYPDPVNYLNIAELLIMMKKNNDAASYLSECRQKIVAGNSAPYLNAVALFLQYANTLIATNKEDDRVYEELTTYIASASPAMNKWSFGTFKKWIDKTDMKKATRKKLLTTIEKLELS